jgi:predicted aspartyl protease
MGLTYVNGDITGPTGKQERLEFLVDSGSNYSLIPYKTWKRLKIEPTEEFKCVLVDGTRVKRKLGECHMAVVGKKGYARVLLGEPEDDEALLGVLTLENFGLVLHPFTRTLHQMRVRL